MKKVSIKEMKGILRKMIEEARGKHPDDIKPSWYRPLIKLGIIKRPEILTDPFYDDEAVKFARKILNLIDCKVK